MNKSEIINYVMEAIVGIMMFGLLWTLAIAVTVTNETLFFTLLTLGNLGIIFGMITFEFRHFVDDIEFYETLKEIRRKTR